MLLRDVIHIPEHISASDFVLKLDSGVENAPVTVGQYVVTEKLADSFDRALDLVSSALSTGGDRGTFVHGSFGSGKSHFMAILHLLIAGNTDARALPGLQRVVAEHDATLSSKVLALDYHLIGAASFEEALFGGYLRQVAALHPNAILPVLHNTDALFANASGMRARMGDEMFFAGLNENSGGQWGSWASWTPESYDAAVKANHGEAHRGALAAALVATYFPAYTQAGDWADLDEGLRLMTAHAQSLGYQALALFLDELVLWLASHLADSQFVGSEGSKVAKLVETGAGTRAIPIVSFVARQRDLRDFLGDAVPGAEKAAVGQTFSWWEDRFDTIRLEASDLPEIVKRRLLQPTSPEGEAALMAAFQRVKGNTRAWDDLLRDDKGANEDDFAKVYPFSPALVNTMVALSGLLQRERTALKVMAQILVEGRDVLTVDDVIPVGDLYDAMVESGDTPLTEVMQQHFTFARALYRDKLRPMLLATHQVTEDDVAGSRPGALAEGAPASLQAFFTDDRLAKTLLIAALAPQASALQNLTASRLAFLNYGTVPAVVPGTEAIAVVSRVRGWADQVGEIQVGDGPDPLISVSISGVDYDSVIAQAHTEDTQANRRSLLRRMVFAQLGLPSTDTLLAENPHAMVWRGSKRTIDLVFGNVRDPEVLPDDVLRANGSNWKLVIDYPFDDDAHGPHDDIARIERLKSAGLTSRTVAWIPLFLSRARQEDLGKLVVLDYLLKSSGENFDRHAIHLPTDQRQMAKTVLTNQRNSLQDSLAAVIKQAYGAASAQPRDLDLSYGEISPFVTLDPGLTLQPPVAADLKEALSGLADQMFTSQFPDHPKFAPSDAEVKRAELNTVAEHVGLAVANGGRVDPVEQSKRGPLRRVANALQVGEMLENHYVFSAASFPWRNRFTTWAATDNITEIPVSQARQWLAGYGMAREVENLLLVAWALLDDKQWVKAGAAVSVTGVEQVTDDLVLREPSLPEESAWEAAVPRAAALFGVTTSSLRSAANVTSLAAGVRAKARTWQAPASDLLVALTEHADSMGVGPDVPRLNTARLAKDLLTRLSNENDDVILVQVLAEAPLPEEQQALAKSMSSAVTVAGAVKAVLWDMLDSLRTIGDDDPRHGEATGVLDTLATAAAAEELHASLPAALTEAVSQAGRILARATTTAPPVIPTNPDPGDTSPPSSTPGPLVPSEPGLPAGHVNDITLDGIDDSLDDISTQVRKALRDNPKKRLHIQWWLE